MRKRLLGSKEKHKPSDETPKTPRATDTQNGHRPIDVDYAELTRLLSYGDTLHTERVRFWVMAHTVFVALLGVGLREQPAGIIRWILCVFGIALCACWIITVWRVSKRVDLLNKDIERRFPDSPHAFWLRFWESQALHKPRRMWIGATCVFTWLMPIFFAFVYLALALWAH